MNRAARRKQDKRKNEYEMKIITMNVRGYGKKVTRVDQLEYMKKYDADVICLQETHTSEEDDNAKEKNKEIEEEARPFQVYYNHYTRAARGVITMINHTKGWRLDKKKECKEGRTILTRISREVKGGRAQYAIINTYAPTIQREREQKTYYEELYKEMESWIETGDTVIWAGDFNSVQDLIKDRDSLRTRDYLCKEAVGEIIDKYNLVDIWREIYPDGRRFTHRHTVDVQGDRYTMARLDRVYISNWNRQWNVECEIGSALHTDHNLVVAKIKGYADERGPGYRRVDMRVLNDPALDEKLREMLNNADQIQGDGELNKLMFLKFRILEIASEYAKCKFGEKKRRREEALKELEDKELKFEELKTKEANGELKEAKDRVERMRIQETQEAIRTSRNHMAAFGERMGLHMIKRIELERERAILQSIRKKDGSLTNSPAETLSRIREYYEELFKNGDDELTEYNEEDWTPLRKLEPQQVEMLKNLEVTEGGIARIIDTFADGKAPGIDGIIIEVYKKYGEQIIPRLVRAMNEGIQTGIFPDKFKMGLIKLIPKPEKDRSELKNWRALTMLGTDYKILMKHLAMRLKPMLHTIISEEQTGFQKGKYIGENIVLIQEIHEESLRNEEGVLALGTDISQAFDNVSHAFMFKAMKVVGIPEEFIAVVRNVYKGAQSTVCNNGSSTGYFDIGRSCRQGCPLSPYLFIIALEVMIQSIKAHEGIDGAKLGRVEIKIMSYADDCVIYVQNYRSLELVKQILEKFAKISGLKTNVQKTTATGLGIWKGINVEIKGFKFSPEPVKTLGVMYCPNDVEGQRTRNIEAVMQNMRAVAKKWSKLNLTMKGRIMVVKTMMWSLAIHMVSTTYLEEKVQKELQEICDEMTWNRRRPRIRNEILKRDYKYGGLRALNIKDAIIWLRLAWINRWEKKYEHPWFQRIISIVKEHTGTHKISISAPDPKKLEGLTQMQYQVLQTWRDVQKKRKGRMGCEEVKKMHLIGSGLTERDVTVQQAREMREANAETVGDYWDNEAKQFYGAEYFREKGMQAMTYNVIMGGVIPKEWKARLRGGDNLPDPLPIILGQEIPIEKVRINEETRNSCLKPPAGFKRWEELGEIKAEECAKLVEKAQKEDMLPRLFQQEFQIKHRELNTRKHMKLVLKMREIENQYCTRCQDPVVENIEHMITECPAAMRVWEDITEYMEAKEQVRHIYTRKEQLFGYFERKQWLDRPKETAKKYWYSIWTRAYIRKIAKPGEEYSKDELKSYVEYHKTLRRKTMEIKSVRKDESFREIWGEEQFE